jgi:UDPglucose--hexose-1-phosphate uridylyltransferase
MFVSPQRLQRPWQGAREAAATASALRYDPACYLCPRNARANGVRNPDYSSTYVFDNDFPAFLEADASGASVLAPPDLLGRMGTSDASSLLLAKPHSGVCRVICYSPRHDLTLAQMSPDEIRVVVRLWMDQARELESRWAWVQIFENKGEQMGCSNPHPHGQIWAGDFIPTAVEKELTSQEQWHAKHETSLLVDYVALEQSLAERIVTENEHWLVVVPWWAAWPYETLVLPRRSVAGLVELSDAEQGSLADLLKRLLQGYDRLFDTPFPYSMGWHGAPGKGALGGRSSVGYQYQLHAHIYSPLLRSATLRKHMVGYEMLAELQRDLTPEQAAKRLRAAVET